MTRNFLFDFYSATCWQNSWGHAQFCTCSCISRVLSIIAIQKGSTERGFKRNAYGATYKSKVKIFWKHCTSIGKISLTDFIFCKKSGWSRFATKESKAWKWLKYQHRRSKMSTDGVQLCWCQSVWWLWWKYIGPRMMKIFQNYNMYTFWRKFD